MLWKALLLLPFLSLLFVDHLYWQVALAISIALLAAYFALPKTNGIRRLALYLLVFTAGLSYAHFRAELANNSTLPNDLHGSVVKIKAIIVSPVKTIYAKPDNDSSNKNWKTNVKQQFIVEVRELNKIFSDDPDKHELFEYLRPNQKLKLSYYPKTPNDIDKDFILDINESIKYGASIDAVVKLREIEGFSVPGGFDIRRFALANHINAFGTVIEISENHDRAYFSLKSIFIETRKLVIESVNHFIDQSPNRGIYYALLFGQKSSLDSTLDKLLVETGTRHLLAVSGLHIGICMAFFGLIAKLLLRYLNPLALNGRSNHAFSFAAVASIGGGFLYLCIAAFPISGIRAFIMASIAIVILATGRQGSLADNLVFAAILILLIDPLTILASGFWLSFIAVALLCWGMQRSSHEVNNIELAPSSQPGSVRNVVSKISLTVASLFLCQWVLFIGMPLIYAPLNVDTSTMAIATNMILVPIFSLLVIPLCFTGLITAILAEVVSALGLTWLTFLPSAIFSVTDILVSFALNYLEHLVRVQSIHRLSGFGISFWPLPLYLLAIVFALTHLRGSKFPGFWVSTLAVSLIYLPALLPITNPIDNAAKADRLQRHLEENDFALTQIDVGQGSAYLLSTRNGHWLYDTGPSFRFGGDAASFSILPLLKNYGIHHLDGLIISHGDNDHSGGFDVLKDSIRLKRIYASHLGELSSNAFDYKKCEELETGIKLNNMLTLNALWPASEEHKNKGISMASDNDSSCVVQLCTADKDSLPVLRHCPLLLTGDIGAEAEKALVALQRDNLRSDMFTAPHHGSNSSSSHVFLDRVAPRWALISSGRHNRYGHPHLNVLQRLSSRQIILLQSSILGTVQLVFRAKNSQWEGPYCSRYQRSHFWQSPASDFSQFCQGGLL